MADLPTGVLCDRARRAARPGPEVARIRTRTCPDAHKRIDGPLGRPVDQVSEAAVARGDLSLA